MLRHVSSAFFILAATAVTAQETRQLDAHEHGVGTLDVAFDGDRIAMQLHAPGADIVGFEYAATTAEDRAAVDAAVATLARPLDLFSLPAAAGCSVVEASASLESEEEHDEHAHEESEHDDHDAHKEENHDHAEHADEGHNDEDHANEASHTEFHAKYTLTCADPTQATLITFAYFDTFPNALELEVQVISDQGATAFEVERAAPTLDLRDMF
ncbi:MAG: DUF2796 domain-containing protein [Sulfitobacter sp.]